MLPRLVVLTEGEKKQPHDAFDLTDNDVQVLGNFPLSPRVRTLLLARNRIAAIQPSLPAAVPGLRNLVLASNQLAELADLDVLGRFRGLTHLVLVDNPVTKKEVGLPWFLGGWGVADWRGIALSVLGAVAVPVGAVLGLSKGQGRGARQGEGAVWLGGGDDGVGE